ECRIRRQHVERWRDLRPDDNTEILDPAVGEILGDERVGPPIVVHEGGPRSAATDRLETPRAGAGVPVEDPCALSPRRENVEQRLAQLVGRRPKPVPRRSFQPAPLQRTGDDTHRDGEMGGWEMGKWGNGVMGKWGNG